MYFNQIIFSLSYTWKSEICISDIKFINTYLTPIQLHSVRHFENWTQGSHTQPKTYYKAKPNKKTGKWIKRGLTLFFSFYLLVFIFTNNAFFKRADRLFYQKCFTSYSEFYFFKSLHKNGANKLARISLSQEKKKKKRVLGNMEREEEKSIIMN